MSRPIYERKSDRDKEISVAKTISNKWGVRCIMLPPLACADMLIAGADNEPKCWAEIKSRNIVFGQYGHLHLSLDKVTNLQRMVELTKIKAIIVANLKDGIFWHNVPLASENLHTEIGGRTDRGDPKDIEKMACFFWHNFKRLA